jgi:hypothetical protein
MFCKEQSKHRTFDGPLSPERVRDVAVLHIFDVFLEKQSLISENKMQLLLIYT